MAAPDPATCLASTDAIHPLDLATWDQVVRAAGHTGHVGAAVRLLLATREHAHDPELLWITRAVRGEHVTTLLARAAGRLDVARVAEILAACPTPACRAELLACGSRFDQTALHMACHSREEQHEEAALAVMEVLLGAGADPRARARYANTGGEFQPVHRAAHWSTRLVQRLVAAGASIDGDVAGNSTLSEAACAGTALGVRMIPALVALGAREPDGNNAMLNFAYYPLEGAPPSDSEAAAALTALVSAGCSLTQPNVDGMAPMDFAAKEGNTPVARALLSRGVVATTKSLAHAVAHPDTARLLLAAGAPAGGLARLAAGDETVTPLMEAAWKASLESVQLLLAAGASLIRRKESGSSALMFSAWSECGDSAAVLGVVEALLAAGADVAARNDKGNTALHFLALKAHGKPWAAAVARLLLGGGAAGGSVENKAGKTPAQRVPVGARGGELYGLLLAAAGA
jgi:ankyrin repeat protein